MMGRYWRSMVRGLGVSAVIGSLMAVAAGCVPDVPAPPTRLDILTQLTWCGGVVPPPGEPSCHTSGRSTTIEVRSGRSVVATGSSVADGHLVVDVPAGTLLTVVATETPAYENCDDATVMATVGVTTSVTQTCTVYAP